MDGLLAFRSGQAQGGGKGRGKPKEMQMNARGKRGARIAAQALGPRESPMSPLSSRQRARRGAVATSRPLLDGEGHGLAAQQRHPRASGLASAPVSPQDGKRSQSTIRQNGWNEHGVGDGLHHETHLTGCASRGAPLTPHALVTGAAIGKAGCVEHADAARAFRSLLAACIQGFALRTAQRAIGLPKKGVCGKTSH